jgi:hypothetical protein
VLPVVLVVAVGVTFFVARRIAIDRAHEDELVVVSREGPRVHDDEPLRSSLTGGVEVSGRLVLAGFCQNGVDWLRDFALNLDIVVATRADLVRAAELAASGAYDRSLIERIEGEAVDGNLPATELREWAVGWGGTDADAYLDARSRPPSNASLNRFVVYATSATTTRQAIVFVDTHQLRTDEIEGFSSRSSFGVGEEDAIVAGVAGTTRLNGSDCVTLLE